MIDPNMKIDIERMKLGEQEIFENLAGCSMTDISSKGLSGKRLAALIYVFAKRTNPELTFEEVLELDLTQASNMFEADTKKEI